MEHPKRAGAGLIPPWVVIRRRLSVQFINYAPAIEGNWEMDHLNSLPDWEFTADANNETSELSFRTQFDKLH